MACGVQACLDEDPGTKHHTTCRLWAPALHSVASELAPYQCVLLTCYEVTATCPGQAPSPLLTGVLKPCLTREVT